MKIMKTLKYALLALVGVGAVACSKDSAYEPGAPEVEGCYGIYFAKDASSQTLEMEPTGNEDVFQYTAYRKEATDAVVVPVKIVKNTDNKFTVDAIEFAEGAKQTTFTITLAADAEPGVAYEFALAVEDPKFVSQYTADASKPTSIKLEVTRIKWVDLGEVAYTEDAFTPWLEEDAFTYNVKIQARYDSVADMDALMAAMAGNGSDADLAAVYRLVDPYNCGPFEGNAVLGQSGQYGPYQLSHNPGTHYVIIDATDPTHVFIEMSDIGLIINGTGSTSYLYSYAAYYMDGGYGKYEIPDDYYGTISGGRITFPVKMLLYSPSDDETKLYYGNTNGLWCLNLAPALAKYTLAMPSNESDADFAFEPIALGEGAAFYSESQVASWFPFLEKGEPTVTTDNVHRDFYMNYGTLYRLPACYADDFNIYFAAQGKKVTLPAEYASQPTGLTQNGLDVYMKIDAAKSSFDPETNEVVLVAEFVGYKGSTLAAKYGTFTETLSLTAPEFSVVAPADLRADFNYSTLFNDTFTSTFTASSWKTDFQQGTCMDADKAEHFSATAGTAYCLPNLYAEGYNLYFTAKFDEEGNGTVSVPADYAVQPTGMNVFGTTVYAAIQSGTVTKTGATLTITFVDFDGNVIPAGNKCKEQIVTFNWLEVATGTMSAYAFDAAVPGRVLAQAEGTNIYRIEDVWGYGKNLLFTWDKTTNKVEIDGLCATGLLYQGLEIYLCDNMGYATWAGYSFTWAQLEANGMHQSYFDPETNTFNFELFYAVPDAGVGAALGGMAFPETFVLDAAPVVADWEPWKVGTFTHTTDFWLDPAYLPYSEPDVVIERYGETDKYRFAVAGGNMTLEMNFNAEKGIVEIPQVIAAEEDYQGVHYVFYCGDWWALASAWGMSQNGTPLTKEQVYAVYPNSYNAETQTLSFYLGYYDLEGYVYTSVDNGSPTIHTLQITGDYVAEEGGAEQSASKLFVPSFAKKNHLYTPRVSSVSAAGKVVAKDINRNFSVKMQPAAAQRIEVNTNKGIAGATPKAYSAREAAMFGEIRK